MRTRPHVVLLCVDALRADAVDPGAPPGTPWRTVDRPCTPAIDALARTARSCPVAVAASAWTKPSVPSMLLSRHPCEHGVLEVAKRGGGVSSPALPDHAPTAAELFRRAGWRTIGLAHNAQLDPALGFGRGFDVFDADAGGGDDIAERLVALRPFDSEAPSFVYIHLIEPHWPFGRRIARAAERHVAGRFAFHHFRASEWKVLKKQLRRGEVELTADELRFLHATYACAVEEADRGVGRVLAVLEESGAAGDAVVLLTADHGEELLDHGLVGHGQSLHEELVRVPFFLRTPGNGSGTPIPGPVGHVDVLPTLLHAAGLDVPEGLAGSSVLASGRVPGPVFSEVKHKRRVHHAVHDGRHKLIRSYRFRRREGGADRDDYHNLNELFAGRPVHLTTRLFDVEEDPGETRDLAAERPEIATRLGAAIDRWWETAKRRPDPEAGGPMDFEEELIRRLEALGYL